MLACAQTNLQLFAQLRAAAWPAADLARIRAAYDLGGHLVSGVFTPCGKPLLEHLVGTASLAAAFGRPVEAVVAMLLHAVYTHGDFGVRGWSTPSRRTEVRRVVGREAESQLWAYTLLRWNGDTRPALRGRLDALGGPEREAVVLRLVNTLELQMDLGGLYCTSADGRRRAIERQGELMIDMAERLGVGALAAALTDAFREVRAASVPTELQNPAGGPRHRFVRPLSYRRTVPGLVAARLHRFLARGRDAHD